MKAWHRYLISDTLKALLPFQRRLRAIKRQIVPYRTDLSNDTDLLEQGLAQIQLLRGVGFNPSDQSDGFKANVIDRLDQPRIDAR